MKWSQCTVVIVLLLAATASAQEIASGPPVDVQDPVDLPTSLLFPDPFHVYDQSTQGVEKSSRGSCDPEATCCVSVSCYDGSTISCSGDTCSTESTQCGGKVICNGVTMGECGQVTESRSTPDGCCEIQGFTQRVVYEYRVCGGPWQVARIACEPNCMFE